jgi:hypothetical protein
VTSLKDRTSFVRFCAIERLGDAGDPNAKGISLTRGPGLHLGRGGCSK